MNKEEIEARREWIPKRIALIDGYSLTAPMDVKIKLENERKTLIKEYQELPPEEHVMGPIYFTTVVELRSELFTISVDKSKNSYTARWNTQPNFRYWDLTVDIKNKMISYFIQNSDTRGEVVKITHPILIDQPIPQAPIPKREPQPELKTWNCNCGKLWNFEQLQCPLCRMCRDKEAKKELEKMLGYAVDEIPLNGPLEPEEEKKQSLLDKVKEKLK